MKSLPCQIRSLFDDLCFEHVPCLYEFMQNLYLILISFQRVPLDFDDKSGLWYLERELPVSEIVKTGLL